MKDEQECLEQAEGLERLAAGEADPVRQKAYRQMAAFWRASAKERLNNLKL